MGITDVFKHKPSLEELEEEDEVWDKKLSIAQKKAAIAELKKRGESPSHFKNVFGRIDFQKIVSWLKEH